MKYLKNITSVLLLLTAFALASCNGKKETRLLEACDEGDLAEVKALLAAGADPNAKDGDGYSAIMYGSGARNYGILRELILAGADVNYKTPDGNTPLLMYAASDISRAKILIDSGAFIDCQNRDGNTPLMISLMAGREDLSDFLITQGSDQKIANKSGVTAFDILREKSGTK